LRQVSGVGALTALTFVLTLENPTAFERVARWELPRLKAETKPVRRMLTPARHFKERRFLST
jgi:hypothetical protein